MQLHEEKIIQDNKIDLKYLPSHVRRELIDYYSFLVKRYGIKREYIKNAKVKRSQAYIRARKILKKCKGSLSKDIIDSREDRI
ncbi:MAG: hypothetical protein JRI32_06750 [Deltaproteobacteria bacterium]|nr:hypothetical protein [Deltaproteobacteria bacterium]